MTDDAHAGPDHRLERLMFFSDAVFAIAITLLVIEIHVPELPLGASDAAWWQAMLHLEPQLAGFAISFLVVGAFWASHHTMFALLTHFDQRLVWANLWMLLAIAVVPFTTGLISSGATSPVPYLVYAAALLLAALAKLRLTALAMRPELLADGVSHERMEAERRRGWIMPIATSATLLLALVAPGWNMLAMLIVPLARRVPPFTLPAASPATV
ncbi:TMEM175 family protein [Sphingomonas sp. ac-8]|uniref:TMEM175 family protein n=1 Tax=Sphingomonas sp. ac-8 TaxID=3242977 RepID=UPI003A7FB4E7